MYKKIVKINTAELSALLPDNKCQYDRLQTLINIVNTHVEYLDDLIVQNRDDISEYKQIEEMLETIISSLGMVRSYFHFQILPNLPIDHVLGSYIIIPCDVMTSLNHDLEILKESDSLRVVDFFMIREMHNMARQVFTIKH